MKSHLAGLDTQPIFLQLVFFTDSVYLRQCRESQKEYLSISPTEQQTVARAWEVTFDRNTQLAWYWLMSTNLLFIEFSYRTISVLVIYQLSLSGYCFD